MRLIDADALARKLSSYTEYSDDGEQEINADAVFISIKEAPTVDAVEVVHGEWIYDSGDEYADHYHCSVCGEKIDLCNEIFTEMKPKYCPNCGAKMDGACRERVKL